MSSDSDPEMCTPPEVRKIGEIATRNLLPHRSHKKYNMAYQNFLDWSSSKNIKSFSENVLLAYFKELSMKHKSSSLWTFYSMLRSTLSINKRVNIGTFMKLRAFLKRKAESYTPKKAKTFTPEELNKFLTEAPDEKYLATKVGLIMGIMGACRAVELYSMQITDIQDLGSAFMVTVPNTKTKITRRFTVTGNFYNICKKYLDVRPLRIVQPPLFYKFQNGQYFAQRIGINKFGAMGKEVATFLKLPDSNLYTGHCFRRSSATLLVDAGGDITTLKRHGGWRSSGVAEGYIDESTKNKTETANKIYGIINDQPIASTSKFIQPTRNETITVDNSTPSINITNCSHFTINYSNYSNQNKD